MTLDDIREFEEGWKERNKSVQVEFGHKWAVVYLAGMFTLTSLAEIADFIRQLQEEGMDG